MSLWTMVAAWVALSVAFGASWGPALNWLERRRVRREVERRRGNGRDA